MSNSRIQNFEKSREVANPTVGFKFHASDEELEELQSKNLGDKINQTNLELKLKNALLSSDSLDNAKFDEGKNETVGDVNKDHWNLLGRRSFSVDSTYESPFSNPIETWRKLSELKEKITKTVEEKISEMKTDRNAISKSRQTRFINSKENSSVSDSEDTSESSKVSEQWKDAEDLNLSPSEISNENLDFITNNLETVVENIKMEEETREAEIELRNRKSFKKVSELIKFSNIKVATAKSELEENSLERNLNDEVESGVEADENLDPTESESMNFFEDTTLQLPGNNSHNPPFRGEDVNLRVFNFFTQIFFSQTYVFVLLLGFCLYILLPMSDFAQGFLLCFLMVGFWEKTKSYLLFDESSLLQHKPLIIPDYKSFPPLKVPPYEPVYGVWMNEYEFESYDPDYYSVTQTVPAYLELENTLLKLSRPKEKIHKRATYDEPKYKFEFISQRIYDIKGCNVYLMPDGLTRRRLFSKKYPIVIFLKPDSLIFEKKKGKEIDENESCEGSEAEENNLTSMDSQKNRSSLYLFARCDRQKEEWYRRLLAATKLSLSPVQKQNDILETTGEKENSDDSSIKEPSTPFENLFFNDSVAQIEEYLQYMSKFVNLEVNRHEVKSVKLRSSRYRKLKTKKKDSHAADDDVLKTVAGSTVYKKNKSSRSSVDVEGNQEVKQEILNSSLQIQWFNAFVNRILFDIFRSPYWLDKIHDKVEKKLNSIRLPYYIEDIEVTEMDLGKTGPIFHRVSAPYLDERGLWFDMDVTFDGLIKLTIQTNLNLIKLQKGFEEENGMAHSQDKLEKGKKKKKEMKIFFSNKESKESKQEFVYDSFETDSHSKNSRSPIYDSELEDSAESSDEDEEEEVINLSKQIPPDSEEHPPASMARRYPVNRRSSKRLFRVFENVAQSKYFKSMAQSKYIRKAIAGVSATKLKLTLEIKSCTGILSINIPPPPSDRFWYGFREMPNLSFSANPKIGSKALRFIHIRNFLQKKILHELKKVMVSPNMIDFVLPTTSPAGNSDSLPIELPDLDDQEVTPSE